MYETSLGMTRSRGFDLRGRHGHTRDMLPAGPRGSNPPLPSPPRTEDGAGQPLTRSPGARSVIHLLCGLRHRDHVASSSSVSTSTVGTMVCASCINLVSSGDGVLRKLHVDGTYAAVRPIQLLHQLRQSSQIRVPVEVQSRPRCEVPVLLRHPCQIVVIEPSTAVAPRDVWRSKELPLGTCQLSFYIWHRSCIWSSGLGFKGQRETLMSCCGAGWKAKPHARIPRSGHRRSCLPRSGHWLVPRRPPRSARSRVARALRAWRPELPPLRAAHRAPRGRAPLSRSSPLALRAGRMVLERSSISTCARTESLTLQYQV